MLSYKSKHDVVTRKCYLLHDIEEILDGFTMDFTNIYLVRCNNFFNAVDSDPDRPQVLTIELFRRWKKDDARSLMIIHVARIS